MAPRPCAMADLGRWPDEMNDRAFWREQRVLLTGHTGFKGAWLALWLQRLGAEVTGFSLAAQTQPCLFPLLDLGLASHIGDLRDPTAALEIVQLAQPTIVIHMAAMATVGEAYRDPVGAFETNALGTVRLLQAMRGAPALKAALIVTSDKVYANSETGRPFGEADRLGAADPYSASKAAAELVSASFRQSYFAGKGAQILTARAGNVVGGGDWAADRIVPDAWRAAKTQQNLRLRHPEAVRPWQHVLDALSGYLTYLQAAATRTVVPVSLNFGPASAEQLTVGEVASAVLAGLGSHRTCEVAPGPHAPEAQALVLDSSQAWKVLGWRARLSPQEAIQWAVDWYRGFDRSESARELCERQLDRYEALA